MQKNKWFWKCIFEALTQFLYCSFVIAVLSGFCAILCSDVLLLLIRKLFGACSSVAVFLHVNVGYFQGFWCLFFFFAGYLAIPCLQALKHST